MGRIAPRVVGNEFIVPRQRLLSVAQPAVTPQPAFAIPSIPIEAISQKESVPVTITTPHHNGSISQSIDFLHRHSLVVFAILFLLVGSAGIEVANRYWSARILSQFKPITTTQLTHTIAGLSLAVPSAHLQSAIQTIAAQPASLTVGSQTTPISPDVIKSWLKITPSGNGAQDYVQVNTQAISSSLLSLANQYVVAPVNQVSVTHTDGITPSGVILAGKNGTSLSDPSTLAVQAQQAAKSVMNAKGLQFNTPLQVVPFQAVTPAAFPKLLEADVVTKRLYVWQNGQLINTFPSTDGSSIHPTPIGEFHIWAKLTVQTMSGPGYVQPNVPWINYFDHSGDAVHGNYWRPASVFGSVNTSHGCVGLPVSEAEWVYQWAPIGTTVITHT